MIMAIRHQVRDIPDRGCTLCHIAHPGGRPADKTVVARPREWNNREQRAQVCLLNRLVQGRRVLCKIAKACLCFCRVTDTTTEAFIMRLYRQSNTVCLERSIYTMQNTYKCVYLYVHAFAYIKLTECVHVSFKTSTRPSGGIR